MIKKIILKKLKIFVEIILYFIDSLTLIRKKNYPSETISIVRLDAIGDFIIYISSKYIIPKQYDVLMEALETEEENRRWLIKQKRDALANDDTGIVRPPKNFGMHPRRYSSREGNVVNFPVVIWLKDRFLSVCS